MTTLIAWVGVDSRGPSSAYLASDSRISWGEPGWNTGKKVFSSSKYPEIFGYCGDVTFPSMCINQLAENIDCGTIFNSLDDAVMKHEKVFKNLKEQFSNYPIMQQRPFHILHFSRSGNGMKSVFSLHLFSWQIDKGWSDTALEMPEHSDVIASLGSGSTDFNNFKFKWDKSQIGGTSRSIFSAFCEAIITGEDPNTGGAPQLVGVYRNTNGLKFGIVFRGERFLNGVKIDTPEDGDCLEWRNETFERCDGIYLQRKIEAQPKPSPFASSL